MQSTTKINIMIGQLSNDEFMQMYNSSTNSKSLGFGSATIKYGAATINYYIQHEDGSWTNSYCKTI